MHLYRRPILLEKLDGSSLGCLHLKIELLPTPDFVRIGFRGRFEPDQLALLQQLLGADKTEGGTDSLSTDAFLETSAAARSISKSFRQVYILVHSVTQLVMAD